MSRKNSVNAVGEAYDLYADMLYRLALTHLRSAHDAEDAVHDVFIKYHLASHLLKDDEHKRAWLIRSTVNRCRDLLRRQKIRNHLSLDDVGNTAFAHESRADDALDVTAALNALPQKMRTVIVLHYLEGFTVEEITLMLGISASAVKMRLSRGRDLIKEVLTK